jgi:anti-sigma-K factor RskA
MSDHMSDVHKLTGAYAMDALDDLERARFEQHLAACEDCRAEVVELRETAALLSDAVATPPPASLRESVLAGISQVRPMAPEVPGSTRDHRSGPSSRGRAWMPFLVAAALAIIVGVGAMVIQPWSGSDDDVPRLTAAEQVLRAPDAEKVFLDLGEAGRATVVRSKSADKAVITTEDMVSAPEGKAYELWFIKGDAYTSAGLMPDEPDQTVVLDGSAAEAVAVGITVEPDEGSKQPTSEPIAVFDLTEAA